jgi:hypothetical protein
MNTNPSPIAPRCVWLPGVGGVAVVPVAGGVAVVPVAVGGGLVVGEVAEDGAGVVDGIGAGEGVGVGAGVVVGERGIGSPLGAGTGLRAGADGDGYGITSLGEVGHGTGSWLSSAHAERATASWR